jgi:dephospho-CoA kinase
MLVIGLAGGVASGKSLVARCFQHFGATILDADRIGHDVLRESEVIAAIQSRWGEAVFRDGEIDRSALGRIVFDSNQRESNELAHLELITHPRIGEAIRSRLVRLESETPAVVLDAPVMFKAGWDQMCDKIVFVDADASIRQRRARRRGWSEDELARREALQMPIAEKRARSTDSIDNSQSREATYEQARRLWRAWELDLPTKLDSPKTLFPI